MRTNNWHVMPAVIASGILSFSGVLIETAMNVTFPQLMTEFSVTTNAVQWITTGYLLAIAVIIPISAFLIRNFSIRTLFMTANILFLVGIICDAFSPTLTWLLAGRVLQGIGTGIALPLMFHIILTHSPMRTRGMMMGIGSMITSLAPAIGPTYGGILLNSFGWRAIFWSLVILLVISLIIGMFSIPKEPVRLTEPFPFRSFVCLSIGLATGLLAIEQKSLPLYFIGLLALFMFYHVNKKQKMINLTLFRNVYFDAYMYGMLVYQAILLGLSFILPNYLQLYQQHNATVAGMFMFPGALIGALLAPIAGALLDRIGRFWPVFVGLCFSTTALICFVVFLPLLNFWSLLSLHVLMMVGVGLAYANFMTLTLGALKNHETADGNAVLNTMQQLVGAAATAIVAQILGQAMRQQPRQGVLTGAQTGIGYLAIFISCALVLFVFLHVRQKKN